MSDNKAEAIVAEMGDWVRVGGQNWGIYGNKAHKTGFHRAANEIPSTDYSRRRDPAGPDKPVNWNWACAGDFAHLGDATLRARHAEVLGRLIRGDAACQMIAEFIGQPWPEKPVYYWARWNGIETLRRYTGSGHDTWSHIAWWRSRADQRPWLFPDTDPGLCPPYPGHVLRCAPNRYDTNVRAWQARMRTRGWTITVDGYFGTRTLSVVRAFQTMLDLTVDGLIGRRTWEAAWIEPITKEF